MQWGGLDRISFGVVFLMGKMYIVWSNIWQFFVCFNTDLVRLLITYWFLISQVYDKLGNVICHGDADVIKEGHKSFPSGHTSCSYKKKFFRSWFNSSLIWISGYGILTFSISFCELLSWGRVFRWSWLPVVVLIRKNKSFRSARSHCKTLHCFSSPAFCSSCRRFSSGWLLAPLAGCVRWRSDRYVHFPSSSCHYCNLYMKVNDCKELYYCRACNIYLLLLAILSTSIPLWRYIVLIPKPWLIFSLTEDLTRGVVITSRMLICCN